MVDPQESPRHYWLPTPDPELAGFVRHAFRGRRWESQRSDITVCDKRVAMAQPSEMDWCTAPTCTGCNEILISEQR